MDPFYTFPQSSNPTSDPNAWPFGMSMFAMPVMVFPVDFGMQPQLQQVQPMEQPEEGRELTQLQPMQPIPPLIHSHPLPTQYSAPHGHNTETAPVIPSSYHNYNSPHVPSITAEQEATAMTFTASSGLESNNGVREPVPIPRLSSPMRETKEVYPILRPSDLYPPTMNERRGYKRKRRDDDGEQAEEASTHPSMNDIECSPISEGPINGMSEGRSSSSVVAPPKKKGKAHTLNEETSPSIPHSPHTSDGPPPTIEIGKVTGHLSVIGYSKEYSVSTDEVVRRCSLPEALNLGVVGSLLRRGRTAGWRTEYQTLLTSRGVSSSVMDSKVNRKRVPYTVMSLFLEGETIQFAADHRKLMKEHFPFTPLARLIIHDFADPIRLANAMTEVKAAKSAINKCSKVISSWLKGGWESSIECILASPFDKFALNTHALGVQECLNMMSLLIRLIDTLYEECSVFMGRLTKAMGHTRACAYAYDNEFPKDLEKPEIKDGHLPRPAENEEYHDSVTFAMMPGRLTILTVNRYTISVAEVLRRLREPESLNLSVLGSILRKGKTAGNAKALKEELHEHGITIQMGRRKTAALTSFTAVLEGEALALAKDMKGEMTRTFPFSSLAASIINSIDRSNPESTRAHKEAFQQATSVLDTIIDMIGRLQLPVGERIPSSIHPRAYLILNYSSVTHGYGPEAVCSWFETFRKIFDVAAKALDDN